MWLLVRVRLRLRAESRLGLKALEVGALAMEGCGGVENGNVSQGGPSWHQNVSCYSGNLVAS